LEALLLVSYEEALAEVGVLPMKIPIVEWRNRERLNRMEGRSSDVSIAGGTSKTLRKQVET
jgi:hypothetical protein